MSDINHYDYIDYSPGIKKNMNNAVKANKAGTTIILVALGVLLVTVVVMFLTGCASADRETMSGSAPVEETAPIQDAPSDTPPMPPDPECPLPPPMTQPETCDEQLVCHGGRCYERCCTDADCPSDLSCRWGVCRAGQGWGD